MIPCEKPLENFDPLGHSCGQPSVQFILHHSNSVPGRVWTTACCEAHRICLDPPPGAMWVDDPEEITEEEYVVVNVMES